MSFNLRLLIVEDDSTERSTWTNTIDMHNAQGDGQAFQIYCDFAVSQEQANELISKGDYDAAVVDIRLEQDGMNTPNSDGNFVVEQLLESELAIVAVFTGEEAQVNIPDWATTLVRTFRKGADDGEGTPAVMKWLTANAPMIEPIRKAQQTIKREMVQLFTKSIWPRWSQWSKGNEAGNEYLELALTRHLASHVHAVLLESSEQRAHPEEWYFIPPIRNGLRTGDLVKNSSGEYEIVITPRCDLAGVTRTESIQLATCKLVSEEWKKRSDAVSASKARHTQEVDIDKQPALQKKVIEAAESLRRYTQHAGGKSNSHFLPQMNLPNGTSLGPFLVQFDKIRSIATTEDEISFLTKNRVASLTSEFLPSLVERLGSFFSRIGTPDYSHTD